MATRTLSFRPLLHTQQLYVDHIWFFSTQAGVCMRTGSQSIWNVRARPNCVEKWRYIVPFAMEKCKTGCNRRRSHVKWTCMRMNLCEQDKNPQSCVQILKYSGTRHAVFTWRLSRPLLKRTTRKQQPSASEIIIHEHAITFWCRAFPRVHFTIAVIGYYIRLICHVLFRQMLGNVNWLAWAIRLIESYVTRVPIQRSYCS